MNYTLLCMNAVISITPILTMTAELHGPSKLRESKYSLISQLKHCYYTKVYQRDHTCENCDNYSFKQLEEDSKSSWNNQEAVEKCC